MADAGTVVTTACAAATGVARIVCLAEAFKAILTATQAATLQLTYSKANATRWSSLPEGLYRNRVGINLGTLSNARSTAANKALVLNTIKLSPNDFDAETAVTVLAKYTTELDNTYLWRQLIVYGPEHRLTYLAALCCGCCGVVLWLCC